AAEPSSGADRGKLQTGRDAPIRAARGLGAADLDARRRRAGALAERAHGRLTAPLGERRQLRLGQRRRLHQLPVDILVERTVTGATPHDGAHRVGTLRLLAAALLVSRFDRINGLIAAALA